MFFSRGRFRVVWVSVFGGVFVVGIFFGGVWWGKVLMGIFLDFGRGLCCFRLTFWFLENCVFFMGCVGLCVGGCFAPTVEKGFWTIFGVLLYFFCCCGFVVQNVWLWFNVFLVLSGAPLFPLWYACFFRGPSTGNPTAKSVFYVIPVFVMESQEQGHPVACGY